jgi:protoheme IX farnesyltransferase
VSGAARLDHGPLIGRPTVRANLALTRPRIVELLLVTTLPAMVLAARGLPPWGLVPATLGGGAAAAGSANTLTWVVDRDIDAVLSRTSRRPMALAEVSTRGALVFVTVLGVGSVALLWTTTNDLAAALTLLAIVVHVVGDTIPPHSWALAIRFRNDYAAAGVPMLPVPGPDVVVPRITRYAVLTVRRRSCCDRSPRRGGSTPRRQRFSVPGCCGRSSCCAAT